MLTAQFLRLLASQHVDMALHCGGGEAYRRTSRLGPIDPIPDVTIAPA